MEGITYPPSTELIQDEYKHEDNKMGLVYIFYSSDDKKSMLQLKRTFNDQQYNVPPENTIKITKREVVLNALQRIASEDNSDKTCLIIFILGNMQNDLIVPENETNEDRKNCLTVKDFWINFTDEHCESFRNNPKLFFFQGWSKYDIVQCQGPSEYKPIVDREYEFPAEADMLMIYNKVEASKRNQFIEHLCNGLREFGKEDDVLGIVTRFEQLHDRETVFVDSRPLIISTLTRKFFLIPNQYRGYHYERNSNYDSLLDKVCTLEKKVDLVIDHISNFGPKGKSPMHVVDGRSRRAPIDPKESLKVLN